MPARHSHGRRHHHRAVHAGHRQPHIASANAHGKIVIKISPRTGGRPLNRHPLAPPRTGGYGRPPRPINQKAQPAPIRQVPSSRGRVLCIVTVGHDRHGGICLMGLASPAGPSSAHVRRRVSEGDLNPHGHNLQLCSPRRVSGRITAGQRLANVSEGGVAPYVHDPDRPDHGVCARV